MMNQSSLVVDMEEVVTVMINKGSVRVQDTTGSIIDSQISPSYNSTVQASLDLGVFDLVFVATIPALSLATFTLISCDTKLPGSGSSVLNVQTQCSLAAHSASPPYPPQGRCSWSTTCTPSL